MKKHKFLLLRVPFLNQLCDGILQVSESGFSVSMQQVRIPFSLLVKNEREVIRYAFVNPIKEPTQLHQILFPLLAHLQPQLGSLFNICFKHFQILIDLLSHSGQIFLTNEIKARFLLRRHF